jgi:CYTH domain-containing protein
MAIKYAISEIERRWLVDLEAVGDLIGYSCKELEDLYVGGTRLRLRKQSRDGKCVYKLCKKYGKLTDLSEPITNLYLTEDEYSILSRLEGARVVKRRYGIAGGGLDVYPGEPPIAVFEVEFGSEQEAACFEPPSFVLREVTSDPAFSGSELAARHAARDVITLPTELF